VRGGEGDKLVKLFCVHERTTRWRSRLELNVVDSISTIESTTGVKTECRACAAAEWLRSHVRAPTEKETES
jgi:hypothetical protein